MKRTIVFIVLLIIVVVSWVATGYYLYPMEERGTFGDMFGSINALFSGLAFLGIIYAIVLQREELGLQRKELELTRGVLSEQKDQMEKQASVLSKQKFENTFFQLLNSHNELVNALRIPAEPNSYYEGKEVLAYLLRLFGKEVVATSIYSDDDDKLVSDVVALYEDFYPNYGRHLGHYFRSLYNIVKFVDSNKELEFDFEQKKFYTNLVRAQLSSKELALLSYNCLSKYGKDKFMPLVKEYDLLKHISSEDLVHAMSEDVFKQWFCKDEETQ